MVPEPDPGTPHLPVVDPAGPWSGKVSGPEIAGVRWSPLVRHEDPRGRFTKLFQRSAMAADGVEFDIAEAYVSRSTRGVVRGMHFQVPPHDHAKAVSIIEGAVFDAIIDLRVGSPTEAAVACYRLDADRPARLYLPAGIAHGFQALSDASTMLYLVSTEHAPEHDTGVRFDGAGVTWPIEPQIVGDRDTGLPHLDDFASPFRWVAAPPSDPRR